MSCAKIQIDLLAVLIEHRPVTDRHRAIANTALAQRRAGNGTNTTRVFCSVRQMAAPVGRQTTLFGRVRSLAVPGAKPVSEYALRLLYERIKMMMIVI